jgi:hypothetical protein
MLSTLDTVLNAAIAIKENADRISRLFETNYYEGDLINEALEPFNPFDGSLNEIQFDKWIENIKEVQAKYLKEFTEFQMTKKWMTPLKFAREDGIPFDENFDNTEMVLSYRGGLYINVINKEAGNYHLVLEREDWITDNLLELEQRLFDYSDKEVPEVDPEIYISTFASILFSYGWNYEADTEKNKWAVNYLRDFAERNEHDRDLYETIFLKIADKVELAVKQIPTLS